MSYIGTPPSNAFTSLLKQDFSTSATTGYTLDHAVNNANDIALFINFVRQEPTAAYAASGTTLTLTSATASSDDMYCVYLGQALQTVNPANASVGTAQLIDGAVTSAKLASGTGGKVLQLVSNSYSSNISTTSTSYVASGYTTALTPSSTSNKIFIIINGGSVDYDSGTPRIKWKIYADINGAGYNSINSQPINDMSTTVTYTDAISGSFLYSPSTTNAVTVQPYFLSSSGTNVYLNRSFATVTVTAMEIGA